MKTVLQRKLPPPPPRAPADDFLSELVAIKSSPVAHPRFRPRGFSGFGLPNDLETSRGKEGGAGCGNEKKGGNLLNSCASVPSCR
ncbi:hypothetical protein NHX12_001629 [Muraenolepis orangiensis]|uniref:Uncharacterized protein n=1 Tax=Muraenolepis orangiensis TaxID=630683 RepID=A0A9Q0E3E3_9TELE|nr:hypothetical protein NHX12_001629 [Muraenolepis orangiensis]